MLYPLSYGRSNAHSNSPDAASQDPDHSTEKLPKTPLDSGLSSKTGSDSNLEIILASMADFITNHPTKWS